MTVEKDGEPAAAHPIRQDILGGGVEARQNADPRDAGEQAGAESDDKVVSKSE